MHVGGSTVAQMKEINANFNLTWRSFVDLGNAGAGPIARQWNHVSTPTMYLIDQKGVIRRKWVGTPGEKAIDEALERLMGETEKPAKQLEEPCLRCIGSNSTY